MIHISVENSAVSTEMHIANWSGEGLETQCKSLRDLTVYNVKVAGPGYSSNLPLTTGCHGNQ